MQTEKRLLRNAFHTQLLLVWYAFLALAVSIIKLKAGKQDDTDVTWVVFSVLVFGMSLFVSGLKFKERAAAVKRCYETLHGLYSNALGEKASTDEVQREYNLILDMCENHSQYDYFWAVCTEYLTSANKQQKKFDLTKLPTLYIYVYAVVHASIRFLIFLILYALPIVLIAVLEYRWAP